MQYDLLAPGLESVCIFPPSKGSALWASYLVLSICAHCHPCRWLVYLILSPLVWLHSLWADIASQGTKPLPQGVLRPYSHNDTNQSRNGASGVGFPFCFGVENSIYDSVYSIILTETLLLMSFLHLWNNWEKTESSFGFPPIPSSEQNVE